MSSLQNFFLCFWVDRGSFSEFSIQQSDWLLAISGKGKKCFSLENTSTVSGNRFPQSLMSILQCIPVLKVEAGNVILPFFLLSLHLPLNECLIGWCPLLPSSGNDTLYLEPLPLCSKRQIPNSELHFQLAAQSGICHCEYCWVVRKRSPVRMLHLHRSCCPSPSTDYLQSVHCAGIRNPSGTCLCRRVYNCLVMSKHIYRLKQWFEILCDIWQDVCIFQLWFWSNYPLDSCARTSWFGSW